MILNIKNNTSKIQKKLEIMAIKLNFKVRCETSLNDIICLSGNIP